MANLQEANLEGASLERANLNKARLVPAQLVEVDKIHNALMPDGNNYELWVANNKPDWN